MLSRRNCLNSPSGYSLAFIISDGFKITANILFGVIGGWESYRSFTLMAPLKPSDTSGRGGGEEACWEEKGGELCLVSWMYMCVQVQHREKTGAERRGRWRSFWVNVDSLSMANTPTHYGQCKGQWRSFMVRLFCPTSQVPGKQAQCQVAVVKRWLAHLRL